jgi:sulfite reductase (ferredoxin)
VSLFGIEVVKAESQSFDAQIALDDGDYESADQLSYGAMLSAARALVRTEFIDVTEDPEDIVREFKVRFYDTERFFDRFARGKFGQYLLARHENAGEDATEDATQRHIEEAQIFIEAAHACEARVTAAPSGAPTGEALVGA